MRWRAGGKSPTGSSQFLYSFSKNSQAEQEINTPPVTLRSRSFTRFTRRVGLPHFGQSVLLVVSMTFLRSAVFAIFAIALSWDDSSGQASPASSLSRSIQEATRVGVSRETQPSRDAHVSSSRPPRRTASTAGGRPYRVPDERRFRVRQVKAPLSLRRIACLFYLSCQSSAASRQSRKANCPQICTDNR